MNDTILLLGARRLQVPAIHTAKELGLRVIAIDPSPDAPGLTLADKGYVSDLADKERCLDIAKREKITGVLTLAADYPTPMVAYIAEKLKLSALSTRAAVLSTNKRQMREALSYAGVPCPISMPANSLDETQTALKRIEGPAILKPAIGQGGRGITRLDPDVAVHHVLAAYERAASASRGDGILVEEFVEGPEYSVEALTWDGQTTIIAVTEKLTSGYPYYVETGHSQPPRCSMQEVYQLTKTVVSGIAALEIDWSASHSEIRLSPRGPRVIEIGARIGGGYINTHLVPLSTNVDIVKATIQIALGKKPVIDTSKTTRAAAIRFLSAEPGIVQSVNGIDAVNKLRELIFSEVFVNPGDTVIPLTDADGRVGYVICTGKDAESAIHNAEIAKSLISVKTSQ